ncbi:MAG: DUF2723 domain-containing protein [Phycisphaerae bacterium]|nr:DUF2723 domain-containing protein [Phycisphaerae bacterium]
MGSEFARYHAGLIPTPTSSRVGANWVVMFAAALLLYTLTAHPGEQWQDSGVQQLRVIANQIEHPMGLALIHPINFWLGRIAIFFTPREPAFGVTMVSVVASAAAVANVFCLLRMLTTHAAAAIAGALSLMLAHTFWQNATVTESYGLVCFTLSAELLCLSWYARTSDSRALICGAFFNGLGVANHLLNALVTPVHFAAVGAQLRRGFVRRHTLMACVAVWLLAFSPYLFLIIARAGEVGVAAAVSSALFGDFGRAATAYRVPTKLILMGCAYVLFNFPNFALPFAAYGASLVPMQRRLYQVLLLDGFILFLFAVRYDVRDQYNFFAPFYVIVAIFFGNGVDAFLRLIPATQRSMVSAAVIFTTLANPLIYYCAYSIAKSNQLFSNMVGNKPYRDGYAHFFLPWSVGKHYEREVNDVAFRLAEPDGIIICVDSMIIFGLRYPQALGRVSSAIEAIEMATDPTQVEIATISAQARAAHLSGRPVVLVPRDRDHPPNWVQGAKWERVGDLYLLKSLALP